MNKLIDKVFILLFFIAGILNFSAHAEVEKIKILVITNGPIANHDESLGDNFKKICTPQTVNYSGVKLNYVVSSFQLARYDMYSNTSNSANWYTFWDAPNKYPTFQIEIFDNYLMGAPFSIWKKGIKEFLSNFKCQDSRIYQSSVNKENIPRYVSDKNYYFIKYSSHLEKDIQDYIVRQKKNSQSIARICIIFDQIPVKKTVYSGCECNVRLEAIEYKLKSGEFNTLQECRKQNTKTVYIFNCKTCTCEAKLIYKCAKLGPGEYLTCDECIKANIKIIYVCIGGKCIAKQVCKSAALLPGQYLSKDECSKHCAPPPPPPSPLKLTLAFNGAQIFRWTVTGDAKKIAKYTVSVDYAQGYSEQTCTECGVTGITWDITNPQENSARITNIQDALHPGESEKVYLWDVTVYAKDSKGNVLASDTKRSVKILCSHGGKQ